MDVVKMSLADLKTTLAALEDYEDRNGAPDTRTEDWIADEIARRETGHPY